MKSEKQSAKFVVCIRHDESEDLEPRRVYQVLPDRKAAREGYLRVVDESGEDYLYPVEYFAPVRLPLAVAREFALPPTPALQPAVRKARRG